MILPFIQDVRLDTLHRAMAPDSSVKIRRSGSYSSYELVHPVHRMYSTFRALDQTLDRGQGSGVEELQIDLFYSEA